MAIHERDAMEMMFFVGWELGNLRKSLDLVTNPTLRASIRRRRLLLQEKLTELSGEVRELEHHREKPSYEGAIGALKGRLGSIRAMM